MTKSMHRTYYKYILILIFCFVDFYAQQNTNLNCFTIIVGKEVSVDGSTVVAHNEDDFGKQIVNLYKTPSLTHSENEIVTFKNKGTITQINKTNGFLWIELPGMKEADSFVNDHGIVVSSNGCPSREENPDSSDGGILYWLRRLVAERATSAKNAVKIAGGLIDKYGYVSSGRTYTFADKNEAWVFCAVYGKHWVAQRVPDNKVAVIPNYYTIGEINLEDSTNFLGSSDIISHAEKNGWYNPEGGNKFHFAKAYTALTSINHPGNIDRIWRGISLLSNEDYAIDKDLPFCFSPYKNLDIQDLMSVLRDHYEKSELDKSEMYKNGNPHKENNATICSGSTQYSFVAQLRNNMPVEIGTLVWLSFFRPAINIYVPLYLGLQDIPNGFAYTDYNSAINSHLDPPESVFDTVETHAYWNYVAAVQKIDSNFGQSFHIIKNENSYIERKIFRDNAIFEDKVLSIYQIDTKLALEMINDYSQKWLLESRKRAIEISE